MNETMNEWNLIKRQDLIKWNALQYEVNVLMNEWKYEWMNEWMFETLSRGKILLSGAHYIKK